MTSAEPLSFPREILRWVQSLNLSVAIRDIRRDFINGYVIADIISTYHKNTIFLHALQNSHNSALKASNWFILSKAFTKIGFHVRPADYQEIQHGNQNQLITFLIKLFKFLTNRAIEAQKKAIQDTGATQTYLLTETGLENINIENKKVTLRPNYGDRNDPEQAKKSGPEEAEVKATPAPRTHTQDLLDENEDENELAVSKNDIINMIVSNEKMLDSHKGSISSLKSILIKKDLNGSGHILERKLKSRLVNGGGNESKFTNKGRVIRQRRRQQEQTGRAEPQQ
jgi:hypothetical protein